MNRKAFWGALLAAPLVLSSTVAQAMQEVPHTFHYFDLSDAVPSFFDVESTGRDAFNPNQLNIGLAEFVASAPSAASLLDVAFDTISFTIQAAPNYVIKKLTYFEEGTYSNTAGGITYATGSWVVNGKTQSLGLFVQSGGDDDGEGEWGLSKSKTFAFDETTVLVSITNTLNAVAPAGAVAKIRKTAAGIVVETALVPLPPSVWLLGSALFGVGVLGRRRMQGVKLV